MARVAFVNDNFRLNLVEQLEALAVALEGRTEIFGLEIFSASAQYASADVRGNRFRHITLFDGRERNKAGVWRASARLVREVLRHRIGTVFLCHYEKAYIFLAALLLRLLGRRVFIMQDSKFDDYRRTFGRELLKRFLYLPYQGAIVASPRSADYVRFLGVNRDRIVPHYYALSVAGMQARAAAAPAPGGCPFAERAFVCVARLVPKKNHAMLIDAYADYAARSDRPRPLILCGGGPLEETLRQKIAVLGLADLILLKGNLGPAQVAHELANGLCLILPSIEEQFGIAVLEAQALGLPVILSDNCGARDQHVRSGVNGFVIEPDNPPGLAYFMSCLGADEALWRRMSTEALRGSAKGDVGRFVESIVALLPDLAGEPASPISRARSPRMSRQSRPGDATSGKT